MTIAEVRLWGTRIGAIRWDEGVGTFAYDPEFLASRVEVAPITMPLTSQVFAFAGLAQETFSGLPGVIADSLPDKYGTALIDAWVTRTGRTEFNPVDRLCYVGRRGMGALEYEPTLGDEASTSAVLEVDSLLELANAATAGKDALRAWLSDESDEHGAIAQILSVGTSAGGARAKAVVAWNPGTGELRSGHTAADRAFEHWLMKFDGVDGNADKEEADPQGFGRIEYAYYLMAVAAGIAMSPCRLYEEGGRAHFMTRRFDRPEGDKLHAATLCGIAHLDFNQAGAHAYEQAADVADRIGCPRSDQEQLFRRAAFNIASRNQDDHTKNISYLMDRRGDWSLAPAYDMTFAYNPDGAWTSRHQMTLNGKRENFSMEDLRSYASFAGIKPAIVADTVEQVGEALAGWKRFAEEAGVDEDVADQIGQLHLPWSRTD